MCRTADRRRYAEKFPGDPEQTSLENWHAYEQEHPDTFIAMYQFWCGRA
jgi:hypothetical protein